jgi:hypothetical protein
MSARAALSVSAIALALCAGGCAGVPTSPSTKAAVDFAIGASKAAAQEGPRLVEQMCAAADATAPTRSARQAGCLHDAVRGYLQTLKAHHYDPEALARGR